MVLTKFILAIAAIMTAILVAQSSAAQIHVYNNCPYAVSCSREGGLGHFDGRHVPGDPDNYVTVPSEGLHIDSVPFVIPEVGEVIKCGRSGTVEATKDITQLEWTAQKFGTVAWDASLINGNPFREQGFHVQIAGTGFDGNAPPERWNTCWNSHCAAGQDCPSNQAYIYPDDDEAVRTCPGSVVLTWTICL